MATDRTPSDSRILDHLVRERFPQPFAYAWSRMLAARSASDRVTQGLSSLDVLLRLLVALVVPDYLRGGPTPAVEETLGALEKPSLGHLAAILQAVAAALRGRASGAFFEEFPEWHRAEGRARFASLVETRNVLGHRDLPRGEADAAVRVDDLVRQLRGAIASLRWLTRYRLFTVLVGKRTRARSFRGDLRLFMGDSDTCEALGAEWTADLPNDPPGAVFMANAKADGILDLSPFVCARTDETLQSDACFLFQNTDAKGRVVVVHDRTRAQLEMGVETVDGVVPFAKWLERRERHDFFFPNQDIGGNLASRDEVEVEGGVLADRYEVRERLGVGGMAEVVRVWDRMFRSEVALEVLHARVADDRVFVERFEREARRMKQISHPRIMKVDEIASLPDGRRFLRMPVMVGGVSARES